MQGKICSALTSSLALLSPLYHHLTLSPPCIHPVLTHCWVSRGVGAVPVYLIMSLALCRRIHRGRRGWLPKGWKHVPTLAPNRWRIKTPVPSQQLSLSSDSDATVPPYDRMTTTLSTGPLAACVLVTTFVISCHPSPLRCLRSSILHPRASVSGWSSMVKRLVTAAELVAQAEAQNQSPTRRAPPMR
jgi:hypothetical protein